MLFRSFKAIDINFADVTNKKKISFMDVNDYSIGVMNNCGAFLANKLEYHKVAETMTNALSSNNILKRNSKRYGFINLYLSFKIRKNVLRTSMLS